jgi:hypothetical protein
MNQKQCLALMFPALAQCRVFEMPAAGQHHQLWAETIGCRVPRRNQTGHVEAVFERACNISLDSGGLVTVLARRAGNVAHGIRLACDHVFGLRLRRGLPVRIGAERMVFGDRILTVVLSAAQVWLPDLRPGMCDWNDQSRNAMMQVRDLLADHADTCASEFLVGSLGLGTSTTPLAVRIRALLPGLTTATRLLNADKALDVMIGLVGLGPGLTPAGDDFIIGWLAGLALSARNEAQLAFLRAMCAGVESLAQATTSVSRQHLSDACALMFSERLSDLCVAIASGASKPALMSRVAAQLAIGASSGADAASGLMFALADCGPAEIK